jgi:hypothetical protein
MSDAEFFTWDVDEVVVNMKCTLGVVNDVNVLAADDYNMDRSRYLIPRHLF